MRVFNIMRRNAALLFVLFALLLMQSVITQSSLIISSANAQSFSSTPASDETIECNSRECLIDLMDAYFEALVAHDPSGLPFANNVVFVENVDRKPIGEGLWRTATAVPDAFKIYIPDIVANQVGFLGMMEENGQPVQIAARLKILGGKIVEVEHVMARNLRDTSLANLQTPRPGINTIIPERQRHSRAELLGISYSYYDALNLNQGELSPMADDCLRQENGMITVRPRPAQAPEEPDFGLMGCTDQLTTGIMGYIDDIDNRRVEVVDTTTGLALGFSHFRHAMVNKTIPIYGVPGITEREVNFNTFDLPAAHVFKIRDGYIHEIEAMGFAAPYMAPSGWE